MYSVWCQSEVANIHQALDVCIQDKTSNQKSNSLPDKYDGISPLDQFTWSAVASNIQDIYAFGWPVFVFQNQLQNGGYLPKWETRCWLDLYLVPHPCRNSPIYLVLNLETPMVSTQFHIKHDDFFDTTRSIARNQPTLFLWKYLFGFKQSSWTVLILQGASEKLQSTDPGPVISATVLLHDKPHLISEYFKLPEPKVSGSVYDAMHEDD